MEKVADFGSLSTVLVKPFKYQTKRELLTFDSNVSVWTFGVHKMSDSVIFFLWTLECVLNLTLPQMFKMKTFGKWEDYRSLNSSFLNLNI